MGLLLSIVLSAAYFFTIPWHPFPGSFVIKAGGVAILAVIAARHRARMLSIGLLLSAVGDALLEYSPNLFVAGLLAFLLTHITYTFTFLRLGRGGLMRPSIASVVVYSLGLGFWLLPVVEPGLAVPVSIYMVAITAMVVSALRTRNPAMATGALLFLVSDSLLAVNRFRMPVPLSAWLIWSTYFSGQALITTGYLGVGVWAGQNPGPGGPFFFALRSRS